MSAGQKAEAEPGTSPIGTHENPLEKYPRI
jgi:hypothetical protein